MIHSIAMHAADYDGPNEIFATAQGNCCVSLYDTKAIGGNINQDRKIRKKKEKKVEKAQNILHPSPCVWTSDVSGQGHTGCVNCAAFLPKQNGRKLLSGGNDGKLCTWDWQSQACPTAMLHHKRKINWVTTANGVMNIDAIIADVQGKLTGVNFT